MNDRDDDEAPPFRGLKVIDCATYIAGPAAATVLSDFGADVVKIEQPGDGDTYRTLSSRPGQPVSDHNYGWMMDSRNKRSLALNLKSDAGRDILYRLVATADVFITNFPKPVRRRLGLGFEDLAKLNGRLIYAALSAYGEVGEESEKTGFDTTAYWARSGLMDVVRSHAGALPARSVAGMGDHPTAMALYGAIVTALYRRERTGQGGFVASSLLANGMWANSFLVQARLCGASVPPRPPRELSPNALGNLYCCADGRWFLLALSSEERQWPRLTAAIGQPALCDDPRFASRAARRANVAALLAILDAVFAEWPLAHWRPILDAAGLTFGIVGTVDEAATDAQALAVGVLRRFADSNLLTVDSPLQIGGVAKVAPRGAPSVGGHSREVLAEAGFSAVEIEALRAAGTLEWPPEA